MNHSSSTTAVRPFGSGNGNGAGTGNPDGHAETNARSTSTDTRLTELLRENANFAAGLEALQEQLHELRRQVTERELQDLRRANTELVAEMRSVRRYSEDVSRHLLQLTTQLLGAQRPPMLELPPQAVSVEADEVEQLRRDLADVRADCFRLAQETAAARREASAAQRALVDAARTEQQQAAEARVEPAVVVAEPRRPVAPTRAPVGTTSDNAVASAQLNRWLLAGLGVAGLAIAGLLGLLVLGGGDRRPARPMEATAAPAPAIPVWPLAEPTANAPMPDALAETKTLDARVADIAAEIAATPAPAVTVPATTAATDAATATTAQPASNDEEWMLSLGLAFAEQQRLPDAEREFRKALAINPRSTMAHYALAVVLEGQGAVTEAVREYREVLHLDPQHLLAANNLAYVLATHPDAQVRDGMEALVLAHRALAAGGADNPLVLETLAAAYAENGQFRDAVQTAKKAIALAARAGLADLERLAGERLKLYEAGKPFHQPPGPQPSRAS
jgi:tetratricopeptide (TPR) repeat protein